jgi:hypothetical protein
MVPSGPPKDAFVCLLGTMQIIVGAHSLQTYAQHQIRSTLMLSNRKHVQSLCRRRTWQKMLSSLLQLTRRKLMLSNKERH